MILYVPHHPPHPGLPSLLVILAMCAAPPEEVGVVLRASSLPVRLRTSRRQRPHRRSAAGVAPSSDEALTCVRNNDISFGAGTNFVEMNPFFFLSYFYLLYIVTVILSFSCLLLLLFLYIGQVFFFL